MFGFSPHVQSNKAVNTTGTDVPANLPNPVTMHEGLVIKGNVFINRHADPKRGAMSLGLDPCYNTGLPCDKATVRTSSTVCGSAKHFRRGTDCVVRCNCPATGAAA
jgi:hypothetical protein